MSFLAGAKASLVFSVFRNDFMLDPLGECQRSSPMIYISETSPFAISDHEVGPGRTSHKSLDSDCKVTCSNNSGLLKTQKVDLFFLESSEKIHQP